MSKTTTKTLDNGTVVSRSEVGTWGRNDVVFTAYEPSSLMGPHATLWHDGTRYLGSLTSRRLPKEIEIIPQGKSRWSACDAFRAANLAEAYAAIVAAFPEATNGTRDTTGEIRIEG